MCADLQHACVAQETQVPAPSKRTASPPDSPRPAKVLRQGYLPQQHQLS